MFCKVEQCLHLSVSCKSNLSIRVIVVYWAECSGPLGMEGGIISNQQITASSTHRALFGLQKWYPYFARLNKKGLVNAWTAAENDRWPWIQVTDWHGQIKSGWRSITIEWTCSWQKYFLPASLFIWKWCSLIVFFVFCLHIAKALQKYVYKTLREVISNNNNNNNRTPIIFDNYLPPNHQIISEWSSETENW